MKILLLPLILIFSSHLRAEDDVAPVAEKRDAWEKESPDPLIVRALDRLEERLGIRFNIPFPANLDCDVHRKQPLALLTVDGSRFCITRPQVNPYDEPRTVEWMMGPEDPATLTKGPIDCAFDLDELGEFSRLNILADWASVGGNHLLDRGDDESGRDFFERARLTYRDRAGTAKDPAAARLYLAAFEKVALAIQTLRKEEPRRVPDAQQQPAR